MKSIKSIISEEINKFLITENMSTLAQYANQLEQLIQYLGKEPTNTLHKSANQVLYDTEVYIIQIIFAIRRCVKANSLNEVNLGSLRDYGVNIPPELGGNFWYDAKRGYYATKNALTGKKTNNAAAANGKYGNIDTSNVKNEKLSSLLSRYQNVYQTYYTAEAKYQIKQNAPNISKYMGGIFTKIREIINNYRQLQSAQQNAQGQTP